MLRSRGHLMLQARCVRHRMPLRPCACSSAPSPGIVTDWKAKHRQRALRDIVESSGKAGQKFEQAALVDGLAQLEALLPGPPAFEINLESMKASDWGKVLYDAPGVATRLVQLKMHFPAMNLSRVVAKRPQLLLRSTEDIEKDAIAVKKLLERAKNPDKLLEEVPTLLSPKILLSCIVTVNKWYYLKRDPIEVLENDPDLIRRAEDNDTPFEPVYEDESGNFQAPQLNYAEKRADWQRYIDQTRYKQP